MTDASTGTTQQAREKPAILKDSKFTVEEGFAYRAFRTGAIWMNKLFFSAVVLLAVWILLAYTSGIESCVADGETPGGTCSAFLTPTAKYLGAMAIISFLLSLAFGALGLVVGKRILEMTPSQDEVGAGRVGLAGDGHGVMREEEHGQPREVSGRGP